MIITMAITTTIVTQTAMAIATVGVMSGVMSGEEAPAAIYNGYHMQIRSRVHTQIWARGRSECWFVCRSGTCWCMRAWVCAWVCAWVRAWVFARVVLFLWTCTCAVFLHQGIHPRKTRKSVFVLFILYVCDWEKKQIPQQNEG